MPIMDGFKSCRLIYNNLNGVQIPESGFDSNQNRGLRVSRTLIYCLTADLLPLVQEKIQKFPFDTVISSMSVSETQKILVEIKKAKF